jgi:hypothetical protein
MEIFINIKNILGVKEISIVPFCGAFEKIVKDFKNLVPMRKKIKSDIGRVVAVILLLATTFYANANFLRAGETTSLNENKGRVSVVSKSMATYTAPASVVLTNTGQNNAAGFVTQYVLVNNTTQTIAYTNTTPGFSNVPVGNYSAYAVNYNSSQASPNLAVGTAFAAIGGDCVNTSSAFSVIVTSGSVACIPATAGVGTISATVSGHNTAAGFATRYVLTNAAGVIQSSNTTGSFPTPASIGEYRIYAVNYSTVGVQPVFTNGTNVAATGGDCVDVSETPKCFDITAGSVTCTNVAGGAAISAIASGHNTGAGFITRYVLTNAAGVIQSSNTTGSFTAPNVAGEVRIYAVNYSTSGAQPAFAAGTDVSAISGDCVDVSDVPKCFTVAPTVVTCTNVTGGAIISATASGHNTAAGFATHYVLTNASGVIQNSNTTGSFTAPNVAGEVRIYAVNYSTSGVQPVFTNGSNVSAISGDCVDVSDIPKCFTVTPVSVTCTSVISGSAISATTSGNNTGAGFITAYVLTNAAGVIRASNSTGSFTAPAVAGEYRIYAVNYSISGATPALSNGTNVSAMGGDCVDVSDNYRCFDVRNCPTNNCLTARVTRVR